MNDFQAQLIGALVLTTIVLQLVQIRYLRRVSRRNERRYR